jgi:predicted RNA-binding protein with RPS1 domain
MVIINCIIREKIEIGTKQYYSVSEIGTDINYIVPLSQMDEFDIFIGEKYQFCREFNNTFQKDFLSIINPNYKVGFDYDFYVHEVSTKNGRPVFLLKSIFKNPLKVDAFYWQEGISKVKCRVLEYKQGLPVLRNIENNHPKFKIGSNYIFSIKGFGEIQDRKRGTCQSVIVDIEDNHIVHVRGYEWHLENLWLFNDIKCQVVGFTKYGIPELIIADERHPIYSVDNIYKFEVMSFIEKFDNIKKSKFSVIEIKDESNNIHLVAAFPNQKNKLKQGDIIECEVKNIDTRLRLKQVNIDDPYYYDFEDIVKEKELKLRYFLPELNVKDDIACKKLTDQYESRSAFWVFTYTNKILRNRFRESIERRDYKTSSDINKLVIIFEQWIISKGIITSFPNEEKKRLTRFTAERQLQQSLIIDKVLKEIINQNYNLLLDDDFFKNSEENISKLFFYISLLDFNFFDFNNLIDRIGKVLSNLQELNEKNIYFITQLKLYLSNLKKINYPQFKEGYFSLTFGKHTNSEPNVSELNYINLTYCELLLAEKLGQVKEFSFVSGQLLRFFAKFQVGIDDKRKILLLAYRYFENDSILMGKQIFTYDKAVLLDKSVIASNSISSVKNTNAWINIKNSKNNNTELPVLLIFKSKSGFEIIYDDIKGFLPHHHLLDMNLKNCTHGECEIRLNVSCLSYSDKFNIFIAKQIKSIEKIEYNRSFKTGDIYEGTIKKIEYYGLFLSTISGDGLLHNNNIFDFDWDKTKVRNYFQVGTKIRVVLDKLVSNDRAEFSLAAIKNLDLSYYEKIINKIFYNEDDSDNSEEIDNQDSYSSQISEEKAFCIEEFAIIQSDIGEKIRLLELAKQFYTQANNAKSYLVNIYTSYFKILLKLNDCIRNKQIDSISSIIAEAEDVKSKIDQKTMQIFPDSERLLHFLDTISLFNNRGSYAMVTLFKYIQDTHYKDVKTIAKIALANNLLISESEEDADFVFKNLQLIYSYISNGILSLEETIDDRNAKELKEEILYLKEKIKGDESETLEFKSSFFTPILDEARKKKLYTFKSIEPKTDNIRREISLLEGELAKKGLIHTALKSLCAFANTNGGTLLLGVGPKMEIIGLEQEYKTLKNDQNRDGFGRFFDEKIKEYLGESFSSLMTKKSFVKFPEGDIMVIEVRKSTNEVFLKKDEEAKSLEQLYIRNSTSSEAIWGSELAKFIRDRHIS